MAAGFSAQAQAMPASIPLIDIGALYGDDPATKKAVAAKIGAACDDIGFFYAVNHNVSVEVTDRALAAVDSFFSLPIEEKLKVECDRNNRGYRKVGEYAAVKNCYPAQGQAQLARVAENQTGLYRQRFEINVRLVETIEQHQAAGAFVHQKFRDVCGRAEVGTQFY